MKKLPYNRGNVLPIFVVLSTLTLSCSKQTDIVNLPPEISIVHPSNGDSVKPGGSFEMELKLYDESGIHQCVVEVHNNFDNHTHGAGIKAVLDEEPWLYHRGYDIKGESNSNLHEVINVPLLIGNVPIAQGKYHFYVTVEDMQGLMVVDSRDIVVSE